MFDTQHLHPMIVHFPIALIITGFLFEIASLIIKKEFVTQTAFYLLLLGTIGIIAAYISGDIAGEGVGETGTLKTAIDSHENAAKLALWIMVAASATRLGFVFIKKNIIALKWVSFVLFLFGVLAIARTGYYGGQLVYKHAAGVQFNIGISSNDNLPVEKNGSNSDK